MNVEPLEQVRIISAAVEDAREAHRLAQGYDSDHPRHRDDPK